MTIGNSLHTLLRVVDTYRRPKLFFALHVLKIILQRSLIFKLFKSYKKNFEMRIIFVKEKVFHLLFGPLSKNSKFQLFYCPLKHFNQLKQQVFIMPLQKKKYGRFPIKMGGNYIISMRFDPSHPEIRNVQYFEMLHQINKLVELILLWEKKLNYVLQTRSYL